MINLTKAANAFLVLVLTLMTISSALATNSIAVTSVWAANNRASLSVDQGTHPEITVFVTSNDDFRLWIDILQGSRVVRSVINGMNVPANVDAPYFQHFPLDTTGLSGDYQVRVNAVNGGGSAERFLDLHVNAIPVNHAPIFAPITDRSVNENELLSFTVTATDFDSETLTYSVGALPRGASFDPAVHQFAWMPDFTQTGSYPITFYVSDNEATSSQTITITVLNTNRAPVFDPVADKTIPEHSWLTFPVRATDADGDAITYSIIDLPPGATFDVAGRNNFQWHPDYGQAGTYDVTFHANDGDIEGTLTVRITVTPTARPQCADGVDNDADGLIDLADLGCTDAADNDETDVVAPGNHAPTFTITGETTINEGETLYLTVAATDLDNDLLTITFDETLPGRNPSLRTTAANTAEFTWVSRYTDAGVYEVTFRISDGTETVTQTLTITVNNVNRAPKFVILGATNDITVREKETVQFYIVMEDQDSREVPELKYEVRGLSPAQAGRVVQVITASDTPQGLAGLFDFFQFERNLLPPGTARVIISPDYDFVRHPALQRQFSIDFTAQDSETKSEPQTVDITVLDVNRNPVLASIGDREVSVDELLQFRLAASDADRDLVNYTVGILPTGATFDAATRTFTWTPTASQEGNYTITFMVTDRFSGRDSETVTITVNPSVPRAQCADGIDNDGDGFTDLADAGCTDAEDNDENDIIPPPFQCVDGFDNDGDGLIDSNDPGCTNNLDNDETNDLIPPGTTQCSDTVDNDGDGLIDSNDPGCTNDLDNDETNGIPPPGTTQCSDAVDNDGDGLVDLNDPGCSNALDNDESNGVIPPVNNAPTVTITGATTLNEGETLRLTLVAADEDNDPLTMVITETLPGLAPSIQTTSVNTRQLTWASGFMDAGVYTVTVTVTDGIATITQTITITVGNVNGAPVITSQPPDLIREGEQYRYQVIAVDRDNDPLTYRLMEAPQGMSMTTAGLITWTPARTQRASVRIVVGDGQYNAYQYYIIGVREMKEDLKVVRASVTPEVTTANGYVVANVGLLNDGPRDLENLRLDVSFPDWGIGRLSAQFDLNSGDQWSREIGFQVPEFVEPGEYLVRISVGNSQFQEVSYREVYVE